MLFDIHTAIKVRKKYFDLLKGMPLSSKSKLVIDGLFICKPEERGAAITSLIDSDFSEKMPLLMTSNEGAKAFEIYVYSYEGASFIYHELDKNLTEKGIQKDY